MTKRTNPHYLEFAARVRALRVSLGLSQAELAKRLRKPQSYLSKIESCERRVDVIEALSICGALGVTLDILLPKELAQFLVAQGSSPQKQRWQKKE
jgi:transcriptional regulator with XRE-family HTH domain